MSILAPEQGVKWEVWSSYEGRGSNPLPDITVFARITQVTKIAWLKLKRVWPLFPSWQARTRCLHFVGAVRSVG